MVDRIRPGPTQLMVGHWAVIEQRDLGVQIHSSLKVESQVDKVVKKALGMLGFIGQNIEYRSWDILLKLYKTLVRPHLEYCVQFWSPYYRKDIIKLERVQKRFTRMLSGLDGLSYKESWKDWEFFPWSAGGLGVIL